MKHLLLAGWLASQALMGCGTLSSRTETWIDPELRPVVAEWARECQQHLDSARCDTQGIESITRVDVLDEDTIGRCVIRTAGFMETRKIQILREVPLDGFYMRALMLHEMAHCRLGFEAHADVGVMGERMLSEKTLEAKWPELLRETYRLVE